MNVISIRVTLIICVFCLLFPLVNSYAQQENTNVNGEESSTGAISANSEARGQEKKEPAKIVFEELEVKGRIQKPQVVFFIPKQKAEWMHALEKPEEISFMDEFFKQDAFEINLLRGQDFLDIYDFKNESIIEAISQKLLKNEPIKIEGK